MSKYFVIFQHPEYEETLKALVRIYIKWDPKRGIDNWENTDEWPTILEGPYTLGSDMGHKVIILIYGNDAQIENFYLRFYKHCRIHLDRCFPPMATDCTSLETALSKIGYTTSS